MAVEVLEILLGSKARARLMRFFILNPEKEYLFSEIVKKNLLKPGEVRKELNSFKKIGFTKEKKRKNKKLYQLNGEFSFYKEIEKLIMGSGISPQCKSLKNIKKIGNVKVALTSGIFVNNSEKLDLLLVVDNVNRVKLRNLITHLEAEVGKELRYMIISSEELIYRLDMLDRFLINLFKNEHKLLILKTPKIKRMITRIKKQ